jgi:hypothetical protein
MAKQQRRVIKKVDVFQFACGLTMSRRRRKILDERFTHSCSISLVWNGGDYGHEYTGGGA